MAKFFDNSIFDDGLNVILAAATAGNLRMAYLSAPPTTFAGASTLEDGGGVNVRLTDEITLAAADVPLADRAGGGREITVAAASANGAAAFAVGGDKHVAVYDVVASVLLAYTDDTADLPVTVGQPINIPSYKIGYAAPV